MKRSITDNSAALVVVIAFFGLSGCGAFEVSADGPGDDATYAEAACLDLWSLVHFSSGYYLGERMGEDSLVPTVTLLTGYEVIEPHFWPGADESPLNQRCDIVVGTVGWMVERLAE